MTAVQTEQSIFDAIYHRRAVRSYRAEELPESTVRTLLEAAVQAPTAMHLEPWTFVVIQDRVLLKRLSDQAKALLLDEAAHQRGQRQDLVPGGQLGVGDQVDHLD